MQHKDIVDSERHELKGASTALVGSVPVADGGGGTAFQKVGTASLAGSIPSAIPSLIIATDGAGGFKSLQPRAYGSFSLSTVVADIPNPILPASPKQRYAASSNISPPVGMSCTSGILSVNTTGYYEVSAGAYVVVVGEDPTPTTYTSYFAPLVNLTNGNVIMTASAAPKIIFLEVSVPYVVQNDVPSAPPTVLTVVRVDL